MLVGLGFVLALLASLVTTRLVWLYLARRKALGQRRFAPIAEAAHEAERDRLRAENAMLLQKLANTEKNLKGKLAEHMAQTARYRNRLDAAQAEITRMRLTQPITPPIASSSLPEDAAEARLRERLNHLNELANRIERQRTSFRRRATDVPDDIDFAGAEAEAAALESELQSRIQKPKRNSKA